MVIKDGRTYYTLREIAPTTRYSADYLRVRIFQKKLAGIKIGREWYTTKEWLAGYIRNYAFKRLPDIEEAGAEEAIRAVPEILEVAGVPELKVVSAAARRAAPAERASRLARHEAERVSHDARRVFFETEIRRRPEFRQLLASFREHFPAKHFVLPLLASLAFLLVYPVAATPLTGDQPARNVSDRVGSFFLEVAVPQPEEIPELAVAAAGRTFERTVQFSGELGAAVLESGEEFSRFIARGLASVGGTFAELSGSSVFDSIRRLFSSLWVKF